MKKDKLTIEVVVEDGYFIASDSVFYDYGIGFDLGECLQDYIETIRERLEITKSNGGEKTSEKLRLLRKMLQRLGRGPIYKR